MKRDSAIAEAKANPQAYACMGLTLVGGLGGLIFAIFPEDHSLRAIAGATGLLLFVAGAFGHTHFKKRQQRPDFRPSLAIRRTIGISFALLAALCLYVGVLAIKIGHLGAPIFAVVFAVGIFPFVRAMLRSDEKKD